MLKKIKAINLNDMVGKKEKLSSFAIDMKNVFGTLLQNTEFSDGYFAGSYLCDIEFKNCVFDDVYFRDTTFLRCRLESVVFRNCNLNDLRVEDSILQELKFSKGIIFELDVSNTVADDIHFDDCEYESCSFISTSLNRVSAQNCKSVGLPSYYKTLNLF